MKIVVTDLSEPVIVDRDEYDAVCEELSLVRDLAMPDEGAGVPAALRRELSELFDYKSAGAQALGALRAA